MSTTDFDEALAAYQAGNFARCVETCRQSLARRADDEGTLTMLALAAYAGGQLETAASAFERLTVIRPDVGDYWSNAGLVLRHLKRFPESESAFVRGLSVMPGNSQLLVNYGLLLLDMGRISDARHRFLDAHEADPSSVEARILAATACFECGDAGRAERLVPSPDTWNDLDDELRNRLVLCLTQVGRLEEAERLLGERQDPAAIVRLGMLHERTNRIASAAEMLDRVRTHVDGGHPDIQADLLDLDASLGIRAKDYTRARDAIARLQRMALSPQAAANAHFTAAGIADKLGDVDGAMAELAQAHRIYYGIASDIVPEIVASQAQPLRIAAKWMTDEECRFTALPSDPSADQSPVFIVGFPRSGTTMLEQMLDAHPRYASMDERTVIQKCVETYEADGHAYPGGLAQLEEREVERLRALYWSEVANVVTLRDDQVLVDKNPLNMLRLPMIRRLFPAARIVFAVRHPCDVVLSCYMQNFRSPAFMVLCSNLERLAKSYVNAMRFWIHHQPLLYPDVLLLRYERTVSDFPGQVKNIADWLGIADQDYLSKFAEHAARKGYISTPSYSQVIEPVNTRAMGRWHAYRRYFEPVLPILQPIADHWGYSLEEAAHGTG